jgi:signal transduction histidine kinase
MTKILVIGGDTNSIDDIMAWLVAGGYEAISTNEAIQSVEYAIRYQPDLIICDISMPRLDGFGVLLEIRANPVTSDIPFIFLAANSSFDAIDHVISFGADDYVSKPFTNEVLLQAVQARLEKKIRTERDFKREIEHLEQALTVEHEQRLLKVKLVAMFAHDFRNPLSVILSSNSLLRNYADTMEESRRIIHMNRVDASVRQLVQMLDELLMVAQIEIGVLEFKPQMLNVGHLLTSIVDEFQAIYSETYHILFENHFPDESYVDPRLFRQIVSNLISNAIKYSPHGSEVRVKLDKHEEQFRLMVQDQGIGIQGADQVRLFNVFQRASNADNIAGTGLGLAIVKQAVDFHGGSIDLESEVGTGTIFTVKIPIHVVEQAQ